MQDRIHVEFLGVPNSSRFDLLSLVSMSVILVSQVAEALTLGLLLRRTESYANEWLQRNVLSSESYRMVLKVKRLTALGHS